MTVDFFYQKIATVDFVRLNILATNISAAILLQQKHTLKGHILILPVFSAS